MTSLAQQIVDLPWVSINETEAIKKYGVLDDHELTHFTTGLRILQTTQIALAKDMPIVTKEIVHSKATKFVFTEDAPEVVMELIYNKALDSNIRLTTAHLPAAVTWVEWRNNIHQSGVLLIKGSEWVKYPDNDYIDLNWSEQFGTLALVFDNYKDIATPILVLWIPPFPIAPQDVNNVNICMLWSLSDENPNSSNDLMKAAQHIIHSIFDVLFLINTPRVCTTQQVQHCIKKQKARKKAGKTPLVEYRQMTLRVGVGATAYKSNSRNISGISPGLKRKYHNVIGHFRTITNKGAPRAVYVDEHWRGDVTRGVIFRERTMKI